MASGTSIDTLVDSLVSSLLSYEKLESAQRLEIYSLSHTLTFRVSEFTREQAEKLESVLIKGNADAISIISNLFAFRNMTEMLTSMRKARDHLVMLEFGAQKNNPRQIDSEQLANVKAKIAMLEAEDAKKKAPITKRASGKPAVATGTAYRTAPKQRG